MKRRLAILALSVAMIAAAIVAPQSSGTSTATVGSCKSFVIGKTHYFTRLHLFRASHIERSTEIRCSLVRNLLRAAYGKGPLKPIRKVFEGGSGRPTYWFKEGWRCGNGAGGAACRNAERPYLNVIDNSGTPLAILAETR